MMSKAIPADGRTVTYQLQHRKCGKSGCSTCHFGYGHGPYWYAYWHEGKKLVSAYAGKIHPALKGKGC